MEVKKAHLLFEQSGTFRGASRSLDIDAECYDIADEFGKTDQVVDLFAEIEGLTIATTPKPLKVESLKGISRSLMAPDYARNFICDKILGRRK